MKKVLKFQYRFKIRNTQLDRRQLAGNYFGLKVKFQNQDQQNVEIRKNLWLRFSKLKLAYHLSLWIILSNLSKKETSWK